MYEQMLKNGTLPPYITDQIRTSAHEKYMKYFTNNSDRSMTANRLTTITGYESKKAQVAKLAFGFMQGWTTKKVAQTFNGFRQFSDAFRTGQIK